MKTTIEQVEEFNLAFNLPVPEAPTLDEGSLGLQVALMEEEFDEFVKAVMARDMTEAFDGLLDMQYILDGLFIKCGMASIKAEGFAEVHRSNMSKLENGKPLLRDDGKILKGLNYSKPDLRGILSTNS